MVATNDHASIILLLMNVASIYHLKFEYTRTNDLEARTITLKLRYEDFRTVTRSTTLDNPTNTTKTLWQKAEEIFLKWHKKSAGPLRLLGFGVSGLQKSGTGQQQLFVEPGQEKQKRLDKAFDKIRGKFGHDALRRGK